jgi:hypothetical protein
MTKRSILICFLSIVFNSGTIFCSIEQQQVALSSLSTSLSHLASKIINYSTLEKAIAEALKSKNLEVFNTYLPENILVRTARDLVDIVVNARYGNLGWCECGEARAWKRMLLIVQIIGDIMFYYPNTQQEIAIVSLASGKLLQEYLLIRALTIAGYSKLVYNVIDIEYTKGFETLIVKDFIASLESSGLQVLLPSATGFPESYIQLNVWNSADQYYKSKIKSDIFTMVDASVAIGYGGQQSKLDLKHIGNYIKWEKITWGSKMEVSKREFISGYSPLAESIFIKTNFSNDNLVLHRFLSIIAARMELTAVLKKINQLFGNYDILYIGTDIDLLFLDIIKNTAKDRNNVLWYELAGNKIKAARGIGTNLHSYFVGKDTSVYFYNEHLQKFQLYSE